MTSELDIKNQIAYAHIKGIEEGAAQEKTEIARKLLKLGSNPAFISQATGFSEAEIAAL